VQGKGVTEGGQHDLRVDAGVRGDREGEPGAVVEPADDLHIGPGRAADAAGAARVGEAVVGEVGLPGLVRHVGLEPDVGGLRSFGRCGDDQPGAGQVPGDGGAGDRGVVVLVQVPGDGVWAGIQTGAVESLAQPQDQGHRRRLEGVRGADRAARARLERVRALSVVAGLELVDPGSVHPVAGGDLGHGLVLDEQGGQDEARFG
jgi:hypothetical protein